MKVHYNILVKGKVQGVFYRQQSIQRAHELGISGYVRNLPDGNVHLEAEGEEEDIQSFIAWCHAGTPASKVEEVVLNPAPVEDLEGFAVKGS